MSLGSNTPYSSTLSPKAIREGLKTRWLGRQQIYCHDVVESTNTEASSLAREGAPEGTIVLAEAQTRGRGRLERSWISPPGTGLYLSVILRPQSPPEWGPRLTLAAAVAAAAAIHETGVSPELKWPNDIMIGHRKVGGILTEACFDRKHTDFVIVGLGINVNTDPEEFPVSIRHLATSLSLHTAKAISRLALLQALLHQLEYWYGLFSNGSFGTILQAWREYETVLGHTIEVCLADSRLLGVAEDLDSDGALLVRDKRGCLHRIIAGDVVHCGIPERQAPPTS